MPSSSPLRRAPLLLAALAIAAASCGRVDAPPPEVAASCAALPPGGPALDRQIEPEGIDQWLFAEAVLREVNAIRCERGMAPLAHDPALSRAAAYHAGDMALRGFLDHVSPVPGRRTPADRLDQAGADYRRVAENIATTSLYAFDGRRFLIRDRARCDFSFTRGGPPVPRRTYAGAAHRLVAGWMDSRGHRRNILDPEVTRHGAGAAFRPDPETCGELLAAQVFAG